MISEADQEDYKQQNREDKRREFLERRAMMGGPDTPEPCERCGGNGWIVIDACLCPAPIRDEDCYRECSRCLGTGVQP